MIFETYNTALESTIPAVTHFGLTKTDTLEGVYVMFKGWGRDAPVKKRAKYCEDLT
jgi:hypothetical protein